MAITKSMRGSGCSERSPYWDNIKGVLILLVVFAHILGNHQDRSIINALYDCIYMFHMPAFVFVSGYFGKSRHASSFASIVRFALLFFIFNGITGFLCGFDSLLVPVLSFWFLLALIGWRLTAPRIAGFQHVMPVLWGVAILAGFYPSIDNTLGIGRFLCFYPFFMMGYLLPQERAQRVIHRNPPRSQILKALALLMLAAFTAYCAKKLFHCSDSALLMSSYNSLHWDVPGRIALFAVALMMIQFLRFASPNRELPLITMLGRNSLWIYLLHRPVTILLSNHLGASVSTVLILAVAHAGTLAICLAFGSDRIAEHLNRFGNSLAEIFTDHSKQKRSTRFARFAIALVALGYVALIVVTPSSKLYYRKVYAKLFRQDQSDASGDVLYPAMSDAQQQRFDGAFRITFSGDLILLEDQVKRARIGDEYDFSPVFEYAKKYISSADFAIGVFEGPMAGEAAGYSSSNFGDGKALVLNFPDSFAAAVKDAGFDLVTTANNHVLDKGSDGARRTLDVLDRIGLDHTGSYRDAEEKRRERIKLVEVAGIRMAILSYTYGANGQSTSQLFDGELSYVTSLACGTEGAEFKRMKAQVEQDFAEARARKPDLIVVLPHMGTQFTNDPVPEQEVWFDIFKQNGADIILGDHPHVVEPARIEEFDGRSVFTAYCPGNFANIYRDEQGDTSMLIDVYIDRESKEIIGGSVVPLYTQSQIDGNFRALPVFDIVNDPTLRSTLSTDDFERAANANAVVTQVVFGHEMDVTSVTERYYFDSNGFLRMKAEGLALDDRMKGGALYRAISDASSVCFVGDSVTEGTRNGGCPWFEPIEECFPDREFLNYSKGSATVASLMRRMDDAPPPGADLYVIAIGTNDVRYRNAKICAMTAEDYVEQIDALRRRLSEQSEDAQFIFIAPWYSTDGDKVSALPFPEKTKMNEEYSEALARYCEQNGLGYIDANPCIREALTARPDRYYLIDFIHPNAGAGVVLYSEAALSAQ